MAEEVSIVIPVFNEEAVIKEIIEETIEVVRRRNISFELLVIDDGSTDDTWKIVKELAGIYPEIKAIRLGRNFGQTPALSAGFSRTQGKIIVSMDGDGQNDPNDIPRLLEKIEEGYDLVNGWRKKRKDPLFSRKIPSRIANYLIGRFTGLKLKDFGCGLKAYRSELIKQLNLYGEMHRLIPALAYWSGARILEIEVNHRPRRAGYSKYNFNRIFRVLFDLLTVKFFAGYFTRPLHFFGLPGIILIILSLGSFLAMVLMKFLQGVDMTGNPLLILGTLLMIVGIQLIAMGLLGEISIRIYFETQNKPTYVIKEEIGFE